MPFDAAFYVGTVTAPSALAPTHFRRDEALALTAGAISLGAIFGIGVFFGIGRAPQVMLMSAAIVGYICAVHLASVRLSELIRARAVTAIVLFGVHMATLVAWPLLALGWPSGTWQTQIGLPAVLASFVLFLIVKPEPPSVIYRHSAYVALIAAIAAYHWFCTVMNVTT